MMKIIIPIFMAFSIVVFARKSSNRVQRPLHKTIDTINPHRILVSPRNEEVLCFDSLINNRSSYSIWENIFGIDTEIPNQQPPPYFDPQNCNNFKDLSPFINVEKNRYNYTALLNAMKGSCKYHGGTLYSFTANHTCTRVGSDESSSTFSDINLPYCVPKNCSRPNPLQVVYKDEICSEQGGASTSNIQYEVQKVDPTLSEECYYQTDVLYSRGLGFEAIWGKMFQYEVIDFESPVHDFKNPADNFLNPCEDGGGYLYTFLDVFTGNEESNYYLGLNTYLNLPICLGKSCDAEQFFNIFSLANKFEFAGKFEDNSNSSSGCTYSVEIEYEFLGYEVASNIPSDFPSRVPSSVPSVVPSDNPSNVLSNPPSSSSANSCIVTLLIFFWTVTTTTFLI